MYRGTSVYLGRALRELNRDPLLANKRSCEARVRESTLGDVIEHMDARIAAYRTLTRLEGMTARLQALSAVAEASEESYRLRSALAPLAPRLERALHRLESLDAAQIADEGLQEDALVEILYRDYQEALSAASGSPEAFSEAVVHVAELLRASGVVGDEFDEDELEEFVSDHLVEFLPALARAAGMGVAKVARGVAKGARAALGGARATRNIYKGVKRDVAKVGSAASKFKSAVSKGREKQKAGKGSFAARILKRVAKRVSSASSKLRSKAFGR